MKAIEIRALGDAALIVRVADDLADNPEAQLRAVLTTTERIRAAKIRGVIEVAPASATVAVFYDPARSARYEELVGAVREAVESSNVRVKADARAVEVPVCYAPAFGLDLEEVARTAQLSLEEVTRQHAAARYHVSCIGFAPGFPYLSGLPVKLATPRRSSPRTIVPAGSVAIGGAQTGIYPQASPGGWNIIGRTPLRLFDASREHPSTLRAGDVVKFCPITPAEFELLSK